MAGTDRHLLVNDADIRRFMLGGNATITVLNTTTGQRYTYRIRAKRSKKDEGRRITSPYWVSVMTGNDNEQHHTHIGLIPSNAESGRFYYFRPKVGGRIREDDPRVMGFKWLWNLIHGKNMDGSNRPPITGDAQNVGRYDHVEVWHEGKCGCCGRKLTVPESIARGIGPICDQWYAG